MVYGAEQHGDRFQQSSNARLMGQMILPATDDQMTLPGNHTPYPTLLSEVADT